MEKFIAENEIVYETPESWGNEAYFFAESKHDEMIAAMRECRNEDPEPPIKHTYDEESGFYFSPFYRNHGYQFHKLVDFSDESNLIMEYIGHGKTAPTGDDYDNIING